MQQTNIISKPIRVVLQWQLGVTVALALLAGWLAGMHGALSAALGGAVSLCAGGVSAARNTLEGKLAWSWAQNIWSDTLG